MLWSLASLWYTCIINVSFMISTTKGVRFESSCITVQGREGGREGGKLAETAHLNNNNTECVRSKYEKFRLSTFIWHKSQSLQTAHSDVCRQDLGL